MFIVFPRFNKALYGGQYKRNALIYGSYILKLSVQLFIVVIKAIHFCTVPFIVRPIQRPLHRRNLFKQFL